ncbi:MAG TPA: pre-peptidase C-terminal domain-containing protein [Allosphingosinicella sp.]
MRVGFLMVASALALSLGSPAIAQSGSTPRPVPVLAPGQSYSGELSPLDTQRRSGKYEDVYRLEGRRGQRIELRLNSDEFDPYLLITGPGGYQMANDDVAEGDGGTNSRLVVQLPADGTYRVSATSFAPGTMGAYRIEARQAAANAKIDEDLPAAPIQVGASVEGRLEQRDSAYGEGKFQDRYRLTARRGERIRINLASSEFDTVLTLQAPDGTTLSNDDHGEETGTNSRIETVLAEAGDYVVSVTSFADGDTGKYRLTLEQQAGNPRHAGVRGGARVLAVAVGVSDYERISDLDNTDDDARKLIGSLRQAGLLHPQSVMLTNAEATKDRVRAALRRAAQVAGPDDLVMFFFSGHGDQVDVQRNARELDGRSETIELYDEAMTDAELQPLIDGINARMVLVALDACYSGGFRNLVNRPNVMGLFSSEEDLTSLVASRLEAGGYLSYYLRTGLGGEADNDGDSVITSGELTTYLRRRFRLEGDIPAATREDESNYQYLLVERGGIHIDDGVVRLGGGGRSAGAEPEITAKSAVE